MFIQALFEPRQLALLLCLELFKAKEVSHLLYHDVNVGKLSYDVLLRSPSSSQLGEGVKQLAAFLYEHPLLSDDAECSQRFVVQFECFLFHNATCLEILL